MSRATRLILVEGLPGSGKTTTAQMIHQLYEETGWPSRLFLEGNVENPADYEGVAYFSQQEFDLLLSSQPSLVGAIKRMASSQEGGWLLEYRKLQENPTSGWPDELLQTIAQNDIYELPLTENRRLIKARWGQFAQDARSRTDTAILECCLLQNPLTVGMVKYGAPKEANTGFVLELADMVKGLNPLVIYVDQPDVDYSFRKAVTERPREWSEGFIQYYTCQGFGSTQACEGLDGTIEVLKARRELEQEILSRLEIDKVFIDNSLFDTKQLKQALVEVLCK